MEEAGGGVENRLAQFKARIIPPVAKNMVGEPMTFWADKAQVYSAGVYVQGISAYAPHPNAAMLFLDFMLSKEGGQKVMRDVSGPWEGDGFEVVLYGRPEGMTIEHCVLSAAYERVATTCRGLRTGSPCVRRPRTVASSRRSRLQRWSSCARTTGRATSASCNMPRSGR